MRIQGGENSTSEKYVSSIYSCFSSVFRWIRTKLICWLSNLYDIIELNSKAIMLVSLLLSMIFSICKTLFYSGFNVDSYQYYALSLETWLTTGKTDFLFLNYYAKHRIAYPLLIAIIHHIMPFDVSLIGAILNLIFAVGSIFLIRDILNLYNYSEFEKNLSCTFIILSYNFLNYWFDILTDMAGLFFFLMTLYYVEYYSRNKSKLSLILSFVSLVFCIFCREGYILAIIIYIWIIKNRTRRFLVLSTVVYFVIIGAIFFTNLLPFNQIIPPLFWNYFQSGNYVQLLIQLQAKWFNLEYVMDFLKGLIKVGILPVFLLFILSRIFLRKVSLSHLKNFRPKDDLTFLWFSLYMIVYVLLYSNPASASGLRYWLPISWIPFIYFTKELKNHIGSKSIKTIIIIFLFVYPFLWSSGEIYVNRNNPTGTGPVFQSNYYSNQMDDLNGILIANNNYIELGIVNGTMLNATSLFTTNNGSKNGSFYSYFGMAMWFNVTEFMIVRIRLFSLNNATFAISINEANSDFSPGWGNLVYSQEEIAAPMEPTVFEFKIESVFLLRYVQLGVGGGYGKSVIFDYITINIVWSD